MRLLAAFSVVLLLLTGCGGGEPRDGAAPPPPATLVWGINNQPDRLNPVLVASVFGRDLCNLLFLRLADFGPEPEFDFVPQLARSWELSEDGRELTYHLRTDILWHDGVPTTAHDVQFTYDTISREDVPFPAQGQIREIESCRALDDSTVVFRFERPSWEPLYATMFHIVPKHLLESIPVAELDSHDFNRSPIGNGRWRFVNWQRENRLTIEAVDHPLGRPAFDRITFRFIPEDITLRTELLTGGVDVFHRYPHRFYTDDKDNEALGWTSVSDGTYVYIGWNLKSPLFRDRRVREALTCATDRQAIIDAFRAGFGTVVDVPVFEEHPDFNPHVKPVPFDLARAGQLLDEAGWTKRDEDGVRMKDGRRFEFTYMLIAQNEISEEIATMTQEAFRKIGVAVSTDFFEWTVFLEEQEKKEFDALILARSNGLILDPEDVFHSRAIDGRYNAISFSDARVDSLIDLAKSTPDRRARREIWWEYQRVLQEVRAITPLYVGQALYPYRRDAVSAAPMDIRGSFYRIHEWQPARRGR